MLLAILGMFVISALGFALMMHLQTKKQLKADEKFKQTIANMEIK